MAEIWITLEWHVGNNPNKDRKHMQAQLKAKEVSSLKF